MNKKSNNIINEVGKKEKEKEKRTEMKISETDLINKDFNDLTKKYNEDDIKNKNNIIMENINNYAIYLSFKFKECHIKNCQNSNIFLGFVSGGIHITNCTSSNNKPYNKNSFFVIINSNPFIENSTENIFHPLKIKYTNFEENLKTFNLDINNNKLDQIQNFQLLKKTKSPN